MITDTVTTAGGLEFSVTEQGDGPAVILLHGFPELAFSWRRQIPALAEAGFRAIAYDQRGYGRSSRPAEIGAYRLTELVDDVFAVADSLGVASFHLVGHDWGAIVGWTAAATRPERLDSYTSLNVPYRGWPPGFPVTAVLEGMKDRFWYVLSFQEEGATEAVFDADPAGFLERTYQAVAGSPGFLTEQELATFVAGFEESGIFGPLAWYRNIDRNAADYAEMADAPVEVRTLMITVDADPALPARLADGMEQWVPDLTVEHIAGCGHWTQQEQPEEVNRLLIDFLG